MSLADAERAGTVEGVVVKGNKIVAVSLGDTTINTAAIRTFDGDVVTYEPDKLTPVDQPAVNPTGRRVLDVQGDLLGLIGDLDISGDGIVESILLDTGEHIDGSRLRAIGSYAAIVDAGRSAD